MSKKISINYSVRILLNRIPWQVANNQTGKNEQSSDKH